MNRKTALSNGIGGNIFFRSFFWRRKNQKRLLAFLFSDRRPFLNVFGLPFLQKGDEKAVSTKSGITSKILFVGMLLCGLLILSSPALAKGRAGRVIIRSEALEEELIVIDPMILWFLSSGYLENHRLFLLEAPADASKTAYQLQREWENFDGSFTVFDIVEYHASLKGGLGYIHLIETKIGTPSRADEWYQVTEEGEKALLAAFAGETVGCPASVSGIVPEIDPAAALFGSGPVWMSVAELAVSPEALDEPQVNASGKIYARDGLSGFYISAFVIDSSQEGTVQFSPEGWLKQMTNFRNLPRWMDYIDFKKPVTAENGEYASYDWQAHFPTAGCYVVYVSTETTWEQFYLNVAPKTGA